MAEGKVVISTELNTKQFDAQILATEKKLNDLKSGYEEFSTEKGFNAQSTQAVEFRKEIEKTTNALMRLKEQQNKVSMGKISNIGFNQVSLNSKMLKDFQGFSLSGGMSGTALGNLQDKTEMVADSVKDLGQSFVETGQQGEEAGERSGRGFEKGIRSLKRFGMALLGVRGMFTLIRRATSSYLSEHQETANKINAIWVALGNALAPIIETIANAVLYLIGYLNVFLQALGFDVDLTKNMGKSKKAIKETSGAMKELNRQVASFDEMNVVQKDTSTGGAGGGTDDTGAFKMPKLDEGIVKILQDVAGWLKENWTWLSAIAGLLIGKKLLDKFLGLGDALKTLATIGVVIAGVDLIYNAITGRDLVNDLRDIIDGLKEVADLNSKNTTFIEGNNEEWIKWLKTNGKVQKGLKAGTKEQKDYYDALKNNIKMNAEDNKLMEDKLVNNSAWDALMGIMFGTYDEYDKRIHSNNTAMQESIKEMARMYEAGQLDAKQMEEFRMILLATGGTIEDGRVKMTDWNKTYDEGYDMLTLYTNTVSALNGEFKSGGGGGSSFASGIDIVTGALQGSVTQAIKLNGNLDKLKGVTINPKVKVTDNIDEVKNKLKNLAVSLTVGTSLNLNKVKSFFGLAQGGIVNNPGRGVPISNIITGEATNGAEGVVPMNNDEAMDVLGRAIARHVQINLTNNTMLDSKVIARSVSQIQDSTNFITNGRGA